MNQFKMAWSNYSVTTGVNTKDEAVQSSTLPTVVGEDEREVYSMFTWEAEGDEAKIVEKSQAYCQPRKNIQFEQYKFNCRNQEPTESYDQYQTAMSWHHNKRRDTVTSFCFLYTRHHGERKTVTQVKSDISQNS